MERDAKLSDEDLAGFLGIADDPRWPKAIAALSVERRALYEAMFATVVDVELFSRGLGPRPAGVLMDFAMPRTGRS